jgi:phage major head subunit gpT-like protein
MTEWLGNRKIKDLAAHKYDIENKDWQSAISLHKNEISDDQLGLFQYRVRGLAEVAAQHVDQQIFGLLTNGWSGLCYDGKAFFAADHPVGSGTGSNTGGGGGTAWYLLDTSRIIKPLIFQRRKPVEFVALDKPTDQEAFMSGRYYYGADYRGNFGYALWQLAYGSKDTLDPTNYAAARAAMMAFTNDEGVPLGIIPNLLVVPPSLESAARQILHADFIIGDDTAGGSKSNVWKGSAELLVVPWLT